MTAENLPQKSSPCIRFLHLTDTHLWPEASQTDIFVRGHDPGPWDALWRLAEEADVDAVLWSGDVATFGERKAYALASSPAGPLSPPARVRTAAGRPVFTVPGNHDYYKRWWVIPVRMRENADFTRHFQPVPGPDIHLFEKNGIRILIFRVDTSSGEAARYDLAGGTISRADLSVIDGWRTLPAAGGMVDGTGIGPGETCAFWNILLMHHELRARSYVFDIEDDAKRVLLKFIAALPVHLVACGHLHDQKIEPYPLTGPGRLDKRQTRRLERAGCLRSREVLISRAGTASSSGAGTHGACLLDFEAGRFVVYPLQYREGGFEPDGEPVQRERPV